MLVPPLAYQWRSQPVKIKHLQCLIWAGLVISLVSSIIVQLLSQGGMHGFIIYFFVSMDLEWCHPPMPSCLTWQTAEALFHCLFESHSSSSLDSVYSLIVTSFLYWTIIKSPIYMENHEFHLLLCWRSDLGVPSNTAPSLSSSPLSDSSLNSMIHMAPRGQFFSMNLTCSLFPVEFLVRRNRNSTPLFHFSVFPAK